MAQELANTKKRIQSVNSTLKITKAMELVANAKLKRWKNKMENITQYLLEMSDIISTCAGSYDPFNMSIDELKKYKNTSSKLYIVVTSSLGLCGGYNYNVFKFLNNKIKPEDKVIILGTKGLIKYSHTDLNLDEDYVSLLDKFDSYASRNLIDKIINEYKTGKYKEVRLIATEYKNSLTFIPNDIKILPFENKNNTTINDNIIFDPNKEEVLSLLIPKYLDVLMYGKLTEAIVCEHASRRNAMDTATDNGKELSQKLMLEYNKARQQAITQEITEISSAANN